MARSFTVIAFPTQIATNTRGDGPFRAGIAARRSYRPPWPAVTSPGTASTSRGDAKTLQDMRREIFFNLDSLSRLLGGVLMISCSNSRRGEVTRLRCADSSRKQILPDIALAYWSWLADSRQQGGACIVLSGLGQCRTAAHSLSPSFWHGWSPVGCRPSMVVYFRAPRCRHRR